MPLARISSAILIGLLTTVLTAQGQQADRADTAGGWGRWVDPAGDCQAKQENGMVTLTVPGSPTAHDLNPTAEYNNVLAPRMLQDVAGDFEIQVKVLPFSRPKSGTSVTKQGNSYLAAGILVWQDEKTLIRWLRAALGERGDLFLHVEPFKDGERNTQRGRVLVNSREIPDQATHLKLKRSQGQFTFAWSGDGENWTDYATMPDDDYSAKLQVGIAAVNATNVDFAPIFERPKITSR